MEALPQTYSIGSKYLLHERSHGLQEQRPSLTLQVIRKPSSQPGLAYKS